MKAFRGYKVGVLLLAMLIMISCTEEYANQEDENLSEIDDKNGNTGEPADYVDLPKRSGPVPETTTKIPHVQIGVEPVPEVNQELFRRVYSLPGLENEVSAIGTFHGLRLNEQVTVAKPEATFDGREFGHIHHDGSLHVFLEPSRAIDAIQALWGIYHPFAAKGVEGWDGYTMLYTPQSLEELDVTFQLIVDAYNYVTALNLVATDYH